jgi:hypothetical protein
MNCTTSCSCRATRHSMNIFFAPPLWSAETRPKLNLSGAEFTGRISTIQGGRRNANWACIGSPEERRGFLRAATKRNASSRKSCRCDPHPASREIERGYTEFPARGDIPSSGPIWGRDADGKSREQQCPRHTARSPHHRAARSQVSHRRRASHAIALTGQGTLVKASLVRCYGRQDQWVSVAMPAPKGTV